MNDKITLHELVDLFARKSQLSQADAALFAKEFLSLIEEALALVLLLIWFYWDI